VSKRLINLSRAAEQYDTSVKTIRRRIADGTITGYRMPNSRHVKVDADEVDKAFRPIPSAAGRGAA